MSLTRPRTSGATQPEELRLEVNRARHRPWLAVGSLVLIATSTAAFTSLYLKAGNQVRVLVVARPVAQGSLLNADDLAVARLSLSPPLSPIAASDIDQVVGRSAAAALVPGTLLTRGELAATRAPSTGLAVVGVATKPSQLPARGVSPGETVDVVLTGPPGTPDVASQGAGASPDSSGAGGLASPGTLLLADVVVSDVASAPASSGTDTMVVSLLVPQAQAAAVASASAAGQAALVVVSPRS